MLKRGESIRVVRRNRYRSTSRESSVSCSRSNASSYLPDKASQKHATTAPTQSLRSCASPLGSYPESGFRVSISPRSRAGRGGISNHLGRDVRRSIRFLTEATVHRAECMAPAGKLPPKLRYSQGGSDSRADSARALHWPSLHAIPRLRERAGSLAGHLACTRFSALHPFG
jgi:hypothetical protein